MIAIVGRPNPPPVILDDGTTDGKPHSSAIGFGREERLEQSLQSIQRNAGPPILDADQNFGRIGGGSPDCHAAVGRQAGVERFERIPQEIH